MKKLKYLVIVLLILASCTGSQTVSVKRSPILFTGSPEGVGMSTERLGGIDRMCQEAIKAGEIPGVVALVARNGRIVYHKAFGMADNQTNKSLKVDDIFRIASQSKAITATAVMMLWEEG
jgi:CubicO group peptidase (beta-lactamase class C family)